MEIKKTGAELSISQQIKKLYQLSIIRGLNLMGQRHGIRERGKQKLMDRTEMKIFRWQMTMSLRERERKERFL